MLEASADSTLKPAVFANSLVASILSLLHTYQLHTRAANDSTLHKFIPGHTGPTSTLCFSWGGDLLVIGIIANYAAVAADTFSSELGILARGPPRLITSLTLRKVPPGTNGGVTLTGLAAGVLGSMIMVTTAVFFVPFCSARTDEGRPWTLDESRLFMVGLTVWGALGSVLDSVLGGLLQRSVRDSRTGKIVEGDGGERVLVSSSPQTQEVKGEDNVEPAAKPSSRIVESGWDILDNNDVNFLMAFTMSMGSMVITGLYWGYTLDTVLTS